MPRKVILSVDPGIANIGWAVMTSPSDVVKYGMIVTPPNHSVTKRVKTIFQTLYKVAKKHECDMVILEEFYPSPGMSNRKATTDIAKAHGAIQAIPRPVWIIGTTSVRAPQKKRNRDKRKFNGIRLVKNLYGIALAKGQHHVADAILQGRYFYEEEKETWK